MTPTQVLHHVSTAIGKWRFWGKPRGTTQLSTAEIEALLIFVDALDPPAIMPGMPEARRAHAPISEL